MTFNYSQQPRQRSNAPSYYTAPGFAQSNVPFTPDMTRRMQSQHYATADQLADPTWNVNQLSRPGISNSESTLSMALPRMAQARAAGEQAAYGTQLDHWNANNRFSLNEATANAEDQLTQMDLMQWLQSQYQGMQRQNQGMLIQALLG